MEDNKKKTNTDWVKSCLDHCESLGISKTSISLFIHLQEQKYGQDHTKA
ncbi:hypothetical protein [Bacillus sp. 522_BSPC]|nr:hypothetical protein [Bacillus sp. 522_BSPC]